MIVVRITIKNEFLNNNKVYHLILKSHKRSISRLKISHPTFDNTVTLTWKTHRMFS